MVVMMAIVTMAAILVMVVMVVAPELYWVATVESGLMEDVKVEYLEIFSAHGNEIGTFIQTNFDIPRL
jgi:hypothetical protein